jgi:hypothetical protein
MGIMNNPLACDDGRRQGFVDLLARLLETSIRPELHRGKTIHGRGNHLCSYFKQSDAANALTHATM